MKPQPLDLQVLVEADTEDGVIRRSAARPDYCRAPLIKQKAFTAPWLGMHLPMAVADPLPIKIAAVTPLGALCARLNSN